MGGRLTEMFDWLNSDLTEEQDRKSIYGSFSITEDARKNKAARRRDERKDKLTKQDENKV